MAATNSHTYFIDNKQVTKDEYEVLNQKLQNRSFYSCAKMMGGGRSTYVAKHADTNKEYTIAITTRNGENKSEITEK
jgi:uncharacterized protein involved in tolerance to divalent cations